LLREDSEVKRIFGGQLRSQLICPDCSKNTVYYEYHRSVRTMDRRGEERTVEESRREGREGEGRGPDMAR
jgi:hypothetical protein